MKEIHYFDRSRRYPSPSYLATERFTDRIRQSSTHDRKFRKRFRKAVRQAVRHQSLSELRWVLRFYLGSYHDDWYCSLFEDAGQRVTGEITPAYSVLDPDDVARVRDLFPRLKVLLLLRNPIDRAWSEIRYYWTLKRFKGFDDLDRVRRYIDSPKQELRGDYLRMLEVWSSHFPQDQMFVGFYDDVKSRPQWLLSEVFRFLQVEHREVSQDDLEERYNISKSLAFPPQIRQYLARKYQPELERLSASLGGHASTWLREAEDILASSSRMTVAPSPSAYV